MNKKQLIFILLTLFFTQAGHCFESYQKSKSLSVVFGGFTPHFSTPNVRTNYCNEISGSNIIYNETRALRYRDGKNMHGLIIGENSICKPIWGLMESYNLYKGEAVEVHATGGFYHFDLEDWGSGNPGFYMNIGGFEFVPIAAIEVNYTIYSNQKTSVKFNNLITPIISNHSFAVEYTY